MDRGLLVHQILERFVGAEDTTEEGLLAIAEEEFSNAEERGATAYHLLWEIEEDKIREALRQFLASEGTWLAKAPERSCAEVRFGRDVGIADASIGLEGVGEVQFRGKIDRVDVLEDEVRVRDFKAGKPDSYRKKSNGGEPNRSVGNDRALQLPVYLEAAQVRYPGNRRDEIREHTPGTRLGVWSAASRSSTGNPSPSLPQIRPRRTRRRRARVSSAGRERPAGGVHRHAGHPHSLLAERPSRCQTANP